MKERLLAYLKYRKLGYNAFESLCGLSMGTISKINLGLRTDKLALIAKTCPDLDVRWLLTGEGKMLKENVAETKKKNEPVLEVPDLPVLPFSAVAGFLSENNAGFPAQMETCRVPSFNARGAEFLIRCEGDSMYPRYSNGELLAIKVLRDPTFFQWGKVYVLSTNQGCVVKRLFPDPADDHSIICHSENSEMFPDYRITKDDVLGVAIVVGHIGIE